MKPFIFFVLSFFLDVQPVSAYMINGTLKNPGACQYKISIYHIRSVQEMSLLQMDNLIATTYSDSLGSFRFEGAFLPRTPTIYRMHIRKISFPSERNGDLFFTNPMARDKLLDNNFIFLPITDSSDLRLVVYNKENVIENYQAFPSLDSYDQLYKLIKTYDQRVEAVYEKGDGIVKDSITRENLRSGTAERIRMIKAQLGEDLTRFIELTNDYTAAILADYFLKSINGFDYNRAVRNYTLIKKKGGHNKYLSSLHAVLEETEVKSNLLWFKRMAVVGWSLSLLLFVMLIGAVLKIRRYKVELATPITTDTKPNAVPLTRKEMEILELVSEGKSNKEIAALLYLEVSTVKKHISNIYNKAGLRTRTEATQFQKNRMGKE